MEYKIICRTIDNFYTNEEEAKRLVRELTNSNNCGFVKLSETMAIQTNEIVAVLKT